MVQQAISQNPFADSLVFNFEDEEARKKTREKTPEEWASTFKEEEAQEARSLTREMHTPRYGQYGKAALDDWTLMDAVLMLPPVDAAIAAALPFALIAKLWRGARKTPELFSQALKKVAGEGPTRPTVQDSFQAWQKEIASEKASKEALGSLRDPDDLLDVAVFPERPGRQRTMVDTRIKDEYPDVDVDPRTGGASDLPTIDEVATDPHLSEIEGEIARKYKEDFLPRPEMREAYREALETTGKLFPDDRYGKYFDEKGRWARPRQAEAPPKTTERPKDFDMPGAQVPDPVQISRKDWTGITPKEKAEQQSLIKFLEEYRGTPEEYRGAGKLFPESKEVPLGVDDFSRERKYLPENVTEAVSEVRGMQTPKEVPRRHWEDDIREVKKAEARAADVEQEIRQEAKDVAASKVEPKQVKSKKGGPLTEDEYWELKNKHPDEITKIEARRMHNFSNAYWQAKDKSKVVPGTLLKGHHELAKQWRKKNKLQEAKKPDEPPSRPEAIISPVKEGAAEIREGFKIVREPSKRTHPHSGERSPAFMSRKEGKIFLDENLLRKKFEEKAWTKPKVKGVKPLEKDAFKNPEEWIEWNILHELAHAKIPRKKGESIGDYENRINEEALRDLFDL